MINKIKEYTTTQFLYKHTLFNTLKSRQIARILKCTLLKEIIMLGQKAVRQRTDDKPLSEVKQPD